jgi:hypothetical protein
MTLDTARIIRTIKRMESYPELNDLLYTPDRHDITTETRYLLCLETLLNMYERLEAKHDLLTRVGAIQT